MYSLKHRVTWMASVAVVFFLSVAGYLLDAAFRDSAKASVNDRLRSSVYMIIGSADFDHFGKHGWISELADPRLAIPESGHYARVSDDQQVVGWVSGSSIGLALPEVEAFETGIWRFAEIRDAGLFSLSLGVIWEGEGKSPARRFLIESWEHEDAYRETLSRFRLNVWTWFAVLSVVLVVVQIFVLRYGLRPLRGVADEIESVQAGRSERVIGSYPQELSLVTGQLNDLIDKNHAAIQRYRNALGDLAHSLKTPLAVLNSELKVGEYPQRVIEQLDRLDSTIEYQLRRASAAGRSLYGVREQVAPVLESLADSLRKVYAERQLKIAWDCAADIQFHGDRGDLLEVVGNLADNACKWAGSLVQIKVDIENATNRSVLIIHVYDDGPGIPVPDREKILNRGSRLDESREGQGIGLAVVREIVEELYGGRVGFSEGDASLFGIFIEFPIG